jgi:hypothetical protein
LQREFELELEQIDVLAKYLKEMRKQMVFNMYEEGYSVDLIADIVVELTKEEIEDAIKIRKK